MYDKEIFRKLNIWLRRKGNSKQKLAEKMGYSSHRAITNWIKRNSVPGYTIYKLNIFFKREKIK